MSDYLCEDLIDDILVRLPPKSLVRFRSVSKSWYRRISSPSFIHAQAVRSVMTVPQKVTVGDMIFISRRVYSEPSGYKLKLTNFTDTIIEEPEFHASDCRILGSCFGIMCMHIYSNRSIILWNPSIRRKQTVPDYPCRHHDVVYGFGFDPITHDYKIVGLCVHISFVYSMKTNSWSEIQLPTTSPFYKVISDALLEDGACFVDGVLHWVVKYKKTDYFTHLHCIMTFNLSTLVFGMISLPEPNWWNHRLLIIKDSLAVTSFEDSEEWVWIRREEVNNIASWSNALKLTSLKVEDRKGYNPFTGVQYEIATTSRRYRITRRITCGESLELLDKEAL